MTKSAAQILGLRITRVTVMRPHDSDKETDSDEDTDKEDTDTESRSEDDPPLEDLFDALGDFFSEDETKKAEDRTTKPILITGHSGAGKSTVATRLSEKLGLPLTHIDHEPDWRQYTDSSDWETISRLDPESSANERYRKLREQLAEKVLKRDSGVIEGTQLLSRPDLASDHDVVLVDPSEQAVVRRRLQRDRLNAINKNRTYPEPGGPLAKLRADMARVIGSLHRDEVSRFREMPNVNRVTGIRDPRLNRLIEMLRKSRT